MGVGCKRIRLRLPEGMSEGDVREYERDLKLSAKTFEATAKTAAISTVNDLFPEYLEWYKQHRAASTYKDLSFIYDKNITRILGKQYIAGIGPDHFSLYQRIRAKDQSARTPNGHPSNRTINKELDYFGGFLRWCRRYKKMSCERPELDRLHAERPLPVVLTPAEILRILEHSTPLHRAYYLCLYTLGLRANEARNIKQEDLDIAGMTVRVKQKGGSYKTLPLNELLLDAFRDLEDYKKRQMEKRKKRKLPVIAPSGGYIFSGRNGNPIGSVRKALATACRKAGISKYVHPHLFRHSWATHLLSAGVNMSVIQKYLGHARVTTTEWYSHVDVEIMREAGKDVMAFLSSFPHLTRDNKELVHN